MKLALVLAAAFSAASVLAGPVAQDTAAPAGPVSTPAATATKVDYSTDPRMLAAIRHANARADQQCGLGTGNVDLATRNTARSCRRHMVNAATTDAEIEIDGH